MTQDNKDINLIVNGLMQGANIPLEKVKKEICPECEYKNGFCKGMMKWHTEDKMFEGSTFVCKGMRHWITKTN